MAKFTNALENVKIASPCKADWNAMLGDEKKRFCGECKLNVYNLSGMSKPEAEKLLLDSEGRLCVRFYRRADGSVLTKDCPVGWQAVKRRASQIATAAFSLFAAVSAGLGLTSLFNQSASVEVGQLIAAVKPTPTPKAPPEYTTGMVAPMPSQSPTPKPTPTRQPTMGKPSVQPMMGDISLPQNSKNQS